MIELAENDGYLYNGKPKTFIFRIDDKPFPVPHNLTIGEFYEKVSNYINTTNKGHTQSEPIEEPSKQPEKQETSQKIEKGDYIHCINEAKDIDGNPLYEIADNADLQVQKIHAREGKHVSYEVIDQNADFKQRMTVQAKDFALKRKTTRPKKKKLKPSVVIKCDCGEYTELTKSQKGYEGTCEKCGEKHIESN